LPCVAGRQIAWYSKPAKVSNRASLPAPFAALFSNTTEFPAVDRLGPTLFVAYDDADSPYVVYFGGADDEAFVCLRAPRFSTGIVACGNATTTDLRATELAPAALWMAVVSVDASADVVQATVLANETAPDAAVYGGALTLAASRLGAQYDHVTEMAAVRDTNVERRASSYDVVVALLFLLALAMFWHVLLAAALLSWTVSLDRFGWSPRTAFFVWAAVLYVICLAVSLPVGFLGWAVVGVFYALVELVVGGVAIYVACKRRRSGGSGGGGSKGSGGRGGNEEGSSSDSTPEPTPLQEAMEMRETGSNGTFGHETTEFSSTTHMTCVVWSRCGKYGKMRATQELPGVSFAGFACAQGSQDERRCGGGRRARHVVGDARPHGPHATLAVHRQRRLGGGAQWARVCLVAPCNMCSI